jgi:16S rRNA (uracil1498-N3)-methyltransferase
MSMPLFYAEAGDISVQEGLVVLTGGEARHLSRSLRAKPGDEILVSDGAGRVFSVSLTFVGPELVQGAILDWHARPLEIPRLIVFQAVARTSRMDETVERVAEAGVFELIPFVAPRSPVGSTEKVRQRVPRLRKIAYEASKVARRPIPLSVREPVEWPLAKKVLAAQDLNILLWEDETVESLASVLPVNPPASIGMIFGPEGGFAGDEAAMLVSVGAMAVSLGELVLRTESASAHTAMLIRFKYGLLEPGGGR